MTTPAFLRNQWYVAAASTEVAAGKPFGRTICNEPVVLFRRRDGSIAALEDRCPHRKAPLSLGEIIGDEIQCGYHGVRLNGSGACTVIPSQQDAPIPRNFCARSYPVVERHALVFLWLGDPVRADVGLLPDWSANTGAGWTTIHGYRHLKAHYQLVIDNLLDLTHLTYVHKTSLAQPGMVETPAEVDVDGDIVRSRRVLRGVDPAPIHKALKITDGKIDRWQTSVFTPPIYVGIALSVHPAGTKPVVDEPTHIVINSMTPETERTTHYFWSVPRRFALDDQEVSRQYHAMTVAAFEEDAVMIEAQQRSIEADRSERPLVNLREDRAVAAARRIIARKLEDETKGAVAA